MLNASGAPGDAASRIRNYAICEGASSRLCIESISQKFQQYEQSTNPEERESLLDEIQAEILDNYYFVPVYRQAFILGKGPKIQNDWQEVMGAIPQYV